MGLMRVFWPSDAPRSPLPGVLVGFRNSDSDVFVVGILQEVEVRTNGRGQEELKLRSNSFNMSKMLFWSEHFYETVHTISKSCSNDVVTRLSVRLEL
jgi:hypothetical protein